MKMTKLEGMETLEIIGVPTVKRIDPNALDTNSQVLKEGLSVRTSPKEDSENSVYLPSIHNCKDLDKMREFIKEKQEQFNMIVHKTVKADKIGSISRYQNFLEQDNLVIELFDDFVKRKEETIRNTLVLPIEGDKFMANHLRMEHQDKEDFKSFSKVIRYAKAIPFETYDAEFVVEDGKIIFTDLTVQGEKEIGLARALKEANKSPKKEMAKER